jgi:hypothetical protein
LGHEERRDLPRLRHKKKARNKSGPSSFRLRVA